MKRFIQNKNTPCDYVTYDIRHDLYVFPTKETKTQKYLDYLSTTKFIYITGISFQVYRKPKHIQLFIWQAYVYFRMYIYSSVFRRIQKIKR
jgi:hypothetical protein